MRFGATTTIRTRALSIRTLSTCGKSSSQIPRSRASFLPFMAPAISSSVEVLAMSESGVSRSLRTSLDVHVDAGRAQRGLVSRERELEAKVATLQKDYAELHTAIFEAAQVHRRLCAPRLVRFGEFEIASEIFAVRHLPGDFFTVKEINNRALLALGDICGKGLAAGMWTTH